MMKKEGREKDIVNSLKTSAVGRMVIATKRKTTTQKKSTYHQ